jgi:hypothetical protein
MRWLSLVPTQRRRLGRERGPERGANVQEGAAVTRLLTTRRIVGLSLAAALTDQYRAGDDLATLAKEFCMAEDLVRALIAGYEAGERRELGKP